MKDGGYGRGGDHTSGTGGGGAGGPGGGGGGPQYTYRKTASGQGNWNTGGQITGTGSLSRGITPVGAPPAAFNPAVAQPPQMMPPVIPPVQMPPVIPPSMFTIPQYPPVSGPPSRVDLNPATLAPWGLSLSKPSTFPARPTITPAGSTAYKNKGPGSGSFIGGDNSTAYGGDQFGNTLGRGIRGAETRGRAGGGFGGGGGGGF